MTLKTKVEDKNKNDIDPLLEDIYKEAKDRFPCHLNEALAAFLKDKSKTFNGWRRDNLIRYLTMDLGDNAPESTYLLTEMIVKNRTTNDDPSFIRHLVGVIILSAAEAAVRTAIDNRRRELNEQAEKEDE